MTKNYLMFKKKLNLIKLNNLKLLNKIMVLGNGDGRPARKMDPTSCLGARTSSIPADQNVGRRS